MRTKLSLSVAFVGLLILALFVTLVLPAHVVAPPPSQIATPRAVQDQISAASPPPAQPPAPAENPNKIEADKLLSDALRRLAQLESAGVRVWGIEPIAGTSLPIAQAALDKATDLYDRQQYGQAIPQLQGAIHDFAQLAESVPERFRIRMGKGRQAFDNLDAFTAIGHFEIAVALRPGDAPTTKYLQRSRTLPQVLAALARGSELENTGDLDQARELYQKAVELDPEFRAGQEHLTRVDAMIIERGYRNALSAAIANLEKGDFGAARSAAERAQKLKGITPEVSDLRGRIETAAQISSLDRLRKQALALEEQEKWAEALGLYKKALQIEGNAAFAARGRDRAQGFADLHAAIDRYLSEPGRLNSPEPLAHSKVLLAQARQVAAGQSVLHSKSNRLQELIARAETPVRIRLRSDENTQVVIYRVGSLGAFSEHTIELRPGSYTAVGSRSGYRDVRVKFVVSPARPSPVVTVQCAEPVGSK